jgi:hypothetical protein
LGAVLCALSAVLSIGPVILLIWQGRRTDPSAAEAAEATATPRRYSAVRYRAQQIAPALIILLWTAFVLLCSFGVIKALGS